MDRQTKDLPGGVRIRGNSIFIDFYYNGARHRETLKLVPNPKNITYATKMKDAILFDIERGQFDYAKYFPQSKTLIKNQQRRIITCEELFNNQLNLYKRRYKNGNLSQSSMINYTKEFRTYLIPAFGKIKVVNLTSKHIRTWLYSFNSARKTINNAMIPLRKALKTAINEGIIDKNPLDNIDVTDIIKDVSTNKENIIDPFSNEEKEKIINSATGQFKNFIQFSFWSGLRTGELIALKWHDINFTNNFINVSRNITYNNEKAPKTPSGVRKVFMLPQAKEALQNQLLFTGDLNEFVFHNPNTNTRWSNSGKIRLAWKKLLSKCQIRYRYPYQMRHTYASTLLSNGENLAWIATQLGHVNTEMLIRNYGKFIPDSSLANGYQLKGKY